MKIGFIGCGNMGTAMLNGILQSGLVTAQDLTASAKSEETRMKIKNELNIRPADSNQEVVKCSDIVFLAVKPQYYETVIAEIKDIVKQEQIFVSVAPGKTLAWLEERFARPVKLVRTMPNTPAMVGEGMTAYCTGARVTADEKEQIAQICRCFGRVEETDEGMMDAVPAVSGSAPAYVFMFIEAMADAAVADGIPRAKAYTFAAQAVLGSAKMVLETGMHPGALKDMVCSPGGTTIEAVRTLEKTGMRSSVMEAMRACTKKARQL
ncbi:Pyrroline-5-carboxylate reductase [Eubacterium plexicaudatum ASF492]|uniref:Pyrroline-5-carboxylate reductase n=1 Tax=Eubacterium plexicaudatum ASF492 TaxID=1235802 RepID=N2A410_9FIRM|nr:Pyrroline-5-carboxylate reductase [Eubacterium plexicaudatum ASF492]